MTTELYVPSTEPTLGTGRALMVNLHGCVQKSTNLRDGGNWAATADDRGMVVAVPAAPNGGVLLGCWDYYDGNHSRTSPARHDDNLLQLVSDLLADPALDIDPTQVYLSGLSSGGGETMVMGCLAPDVFAGIGINAGPSVGTTAGQIGSVAVTRAQATETCETFAGSASSGFGTQVTSVIYGSNDTTVAPGYNTLNAQVMAGIYGASAQSGFSLSGLPGNNTAGSGTLWSDGAGPRVSLIQNTGMGHNWPAGGGPGGAYITTNSISYPAYVTDFFFDNNRRVDRGTEPTDPPTDPPTEEPTDPPTEPGLFCGSATNAEHEAAGRAHAFGTDPYNPFYANVSEDYMGQGDATRTTLQESASGRFDVVTTC
ncbi:MAG: extracellular catalytic domain type 1 short-chain-length polyhydroxyalkanoate depolymerase [Nocardioides sp.]|uniref:extracellular catalytic domain type 1 short-chain-length polyhydroxyalkanoate depolymerase n=1 Tax=Nocardioides sp. TaxID=35761 RepID=UPI003D6B577D